MSLARAKVPKPSTVHGVVQRTCGGTCSGPGACSDCGQKKKIQRSAKGAAPSAVPSSVTATLGTPGTPLDSRVRDHFEPRFGIVFEGSRAPSRVARPDSLAIGESGSPFEHEADAVADRVLAPRSLRTATAPRIDLADVRIHADAHAAQSAREVNARAYTVGNHIVFDSAAYSPESAAGQRLLAHELTHVMQQSGELRRQTASTTTAAAAPGWRQGFQICSRPTASIPLVNARHGFVATPTHTYGLMNHCRNLESTDLGLPGNPTAASASDHSPDPCTETNPSCVQCTPKPGIPDLETCFRSVWQSYPSPGEYVVSGPNSNTFTGHLARNCCSNMASKPDALGTMPGWGSTVPNRVRARCPPGEGHCGSDPMPNTGERVGNTLLGGLMGGLEGGILGAGLGFLVGFIPGIGPLLGMGIGAAVGGGLGALLGGIAGSRRPRDPGEP
jgi:hypothetical protein